MSCFSFELPALHQSHIPEIGILTVNSLTEWQRHFWGYECVKFWISRHLEFLLRLRNSPCSLWSPKKSCTFVPGQRLFILRSEIFKPYICNIVGPIFIIPCLKRTFLAWIQHPGGRSIFILRNCTIPLDVYLTVRYLISCTAFASVYFKSERPFFNLVNRNKHNIFGDHCSMRLCNQ